MAALLGIGSILLLKMNNNSKSNTNPVGELKLPIIKRVEPKEVYQNIKNKVYKIIVDIRKTEDWDKSHILGALNTKNVEAILSIFTKKLDIPNDSSGIEFIGENNTSFMLVVTDNMKQAEEFSLRLKEINVYKVDYLIGDMKIWKRGLPYTNKEKTLTSNNMKKLATDMIFDLVIDIRDKADYDKKHFKYSVNLSSLGTNPEKVRNLKKIDKGQHILVYGDAPNKIERAVGVLREFGYRNVYFSL